MAEKVGQTLKEFARELEGIMQENNIKPDYQNYVRITNNLEKMNISEAAYLITEAVSEVLPPGVDIKQFYESRGETLELAMDRIIKQYRELKEHDRGTMEIV